MRSWLLFSAVFLFTISVAIAATGGFVAVVAGVRVSARTPTLAGLGGIVAALTWWGWALRARVVGPELMSVVRSLDQRGLPVAAVIAAMAFAAAVRFHTFSASGADASGYLSEAQMLGSGALSYLEPLASTADWPDAARSLAPLGWLATAGASQVPTYAVGLPLLMAVPQIVGGAIGASLVVSASAALSVWFAARLASLYGGGIAALLASVSIATIPVHLFESMQLMSDVPVTAAWLGCWWGLCAGAERRSESADGAIGISAAVGAGGAAALAVLIRPNLAPLAVAPALFVWWRAPVRRMLTTAAFAVPVALAGVLIGYLHWRWFGSPWRSGYGRASEIYSFANVVPNVQLYFGWLKETQGAWLLAAPFALFVPVRALRWLLVFAGLVCGAYFIYGTFEAWPYLRFLLPASAIACVAVSVLLARMARRLPAAVAAPVVIAVALAIGGLQLARARELGVFSIAGRQSRAILAGHYLAAATPGDAVLMSGEQSGALRYYTGRSIVRWDFLDPAALDAVEHALTRAGRDMWIVLDDWEVALFREKFAATPAGALDWPPVLDAGTLGRVQAWRVGNRQPFLGGGHAIVDRVR